MTSDLAPSIIIPSSAYAKALVDHLLPCAELKTFPARKKLFLTVGGERFCYLLITGQARVHKDGSDLLMGTMTAPTLIGPGQIESQNLNLYIKLITPCEIGIMPLAKAFEVVEQKNLWKLMTQHMLVMFNKVYAIHQQLTAPTAYDQVKAQLQELMSEDKSIRNSISAERYIRDKTNLSRSGIMRILSALKEGGYIEVSRGYLLKINSLPEKF